MSKGPVVKTLDAYSAWDVVNMGPHPTELDDAGKLSLLTKILKSQGVPVSRTANATKVDWDSNTPRVELLVKRRGGEVVQADASYSAGLGVMVAHAAMVAGFSVSWYGTEGWSIGLVKKN